MDTTHCFHQTGNDILHGSNSGETEYICCFCGFKMYKSWIIVTDFLFDHGMYWGKKKKVFAEYEREQCPNR